MFRGTTSISVWLLKGGKREMRRTEAITKNSGAYKALSIFLIISLRLTSVGWFGQRMGSPHTKPHSFPMFSVLILSQSLKSPVGAGLPRDLPGLSLETGHLFQETHHPFSGARHLSREPCVYFSALFALGATTVSPNLHGRLGLLGFQFTLRSIRYAGHPGTVGRGLRDRGECFSFSRHHFLSVLMLVTPLLVKLTVSLHSCTFSLNFSSEKRQTFLWSWGMWLAMNWNYSRLSQGVSLGTRDLYCKP